MDSEDVILVEQESLKIKRGFISNREKIALALLGLVIFLAWASFSDLYDPARKYRTIEKFCIYDYDCVIVLEPLTNSCLSVNTLHKRKYDWDTQCRNRITKCVMERCTAP